MPTGLIRVTFSLGPAVNKRQDQKQKINEAPKMLVWIVAT